MRLIPAYLLAMLVTKVLGHYCNHFADNPTPYIENGCLWTLYYEITLYLAVMLLDICGLLRKEVVGGVCVLLFLAAMLHGGDSEPIYSILLPMIFMFAAGSLIYLMKDEKDLIRLGPVCAIGLLCVQFFRAYFPLVGRVVPLIYGPDIFGMLLFFLVYIFCMPPAILWLGDRLRFQIKSVPDISYGLYIFGWPVQQTIIYLTMQNGCTLPPKWLFVTSALIATAIAVFSWYAVEKQALKCKNIFWKNS